MCARSGAEDARPNEQVPLWAPWIGWACARALVTDRRERRSCTRTRPARKAPLREGLSGYRSDRLMRDMDLAASDRFGEVRSTLSPQGKQDSPSSKMLANAFRPSARPARPRRARAHPPAAARARLTRRKAQNLQPRHPLQSYTPAPCSSSSPACTADTVGPASAGSPAPLSQVRNRTLSTRRSRSSSPAPGTRLRSTTTRSKSRRVHRTVHG